MVNMGLDEVAYKADNAVGSRNVPIQETPCRSMKQENMDSTAETKKRGTPEFPARHRRGKATASREFL
jgi:hypothetical protein